MARYDDLDTTAIAYTTFVSTVILLLIILLGRALCYAWLESEDERKLGQASYTTADRAISEQLSKLDGYKKTEVEMPGVPDPANPDAEVKPQLVEKVLIPLDKAKELVLEQYQAEPAT